MSALRQLPAPAREAQRGRLFRALFDYGPMPAALTDFDGRCLHTNRALCDLLGYTESELLSMRLDDLIVEADVERERLDRERLLAGTSDTYRVEQRYVAKDGRAVWCLKAVGALRSADDAPSCIVVHLEDISERKQAEQELRRFAEYDSLTGLRNRRVFEADLGVQLSRCKRYDEHAALLLIDLDNFKQINDSHGHGTGDRMLKAIAETIRKRVRSSDVAARIGGDEFAVLLAHVDHERMRSVLGDLRRMLDNCAIETDDAVISATSSIGAALLDKSVTSAEDALHVADIAMYADKRSRRISEQGVLPDEPGTVAAA
jgi:diguanylate cyclase (GGDEF)-like protein/PAS domain S-box-containing protein